jgi:hypothetical protein
VEVHEGVSQESNGQMEIPYEVIRRASKIIRYNTIRIAINSVAEPEPQGAAFFGRSRIYSSCFISFKSKNMKK